MDSNGSDEILLAVLDGFAHGLEEVDLERIGAIFRRPVRLVRRPHSLDSYYDSVRDQHHSTAILKHFIAIDGPTPPHSCFLVKADLYIPILTFVFGEAQMGGRVSIVSGARLAEGFYMRPDNPGLERERLLKEIVHELGHNFGLIHCFDDLCVMRNSYLIEDTDRKSVYPCDMCFGVLDG